MNRSTLARAVASFAGFLALVASPVSQAQESYKGPKDLPQFIARLPKYCYAQYVDIKLWNNPEYSIIKACGIGMNHFCPGLLNLMRAETANPPKYFYRGGWQPIRRQEEANWARENVEYTIKRMPPNCIYREDVYAALARAQLAQKLTASSGAR